VNEWKLYYRQGLQKVARAKRLERECEQLAQRLGRTPTADEVKQVRLAVEDREIALDFWGPWRASATVVFLLLGFLGWRFMLAEAVTPTLLCIGGSSFFLFLAIRAHLEVQRGKRMDPAAIQSPPQKQQASG
jgi:hypothetical protein